MENFQKFGPVGNKCGRKIWDEKGRSEIVQISISYNTNAIQALRFQYLQKDGKLDMNLQTVGDTTFSGFHLRTITFESPSEYITGVEGTLGTCRYIGSLTVKTNKGSYGPFGDGGGWPFSFGFGPRNLFGGFHGTCDTAGITSIGVYLKTLTSLPAKLERN